jgi:hypothetical protein
LNRVNELMFKITNVLGIEDENLLGCSLVGVDRRYEPLMTEVVRTSETSVYSSDTTWLCIPEGSHLHTGSRANLKCHFFDSIRRPSFILKSVLF